MELGNMAFGNSRGEYPVDRGLQDMFIAHLNEMGYDLYGNPLKHDSTTFDYLALIVTRDGSHYKFETDKYVIMPYYWGECEEIESLPNFIYKPDGFELSWYKYALRDSYANRGVTYEYLDKILSDCREV